MLKKSLLVFGLASLIIVINAQIGIDFSQDISYETNIFRLSHEDITKFENGNSEFSFVKSRDDIIYNPSLEINYKFNFRKFSTNPSIKLSKNYYYNNSEKNSYAIYASVNNDLNFLHMNLSVGTNMNNYARDYADHDADNDGNFDNDVFQPYKYDKNMYKIYLYKRIYDIIPISYLKYEEYFYNKYFTEHDGNSLSVGFGTKFVFSNSYLKLFYEYRTFVTNNHNDFDTNVKPDYFRDSSFDSNKYSIELKTKKIDFIIKNAIRPKISYSFEQKFYTTDAPIEWDVIHSTRQDVSNNAKFGCQFYFFKNIIFDFEYQYSLRIVESEWTGLDELKDFTDSKITLNIMYKF